MLHPQNTGLGCNQEINIQTYIEATPYCPETIFQGVEEQLGSWIRYLICALVLDNIDVPNL